MSIIERLINLNWITTFELLILLLVAFLLALPLGINQEKQAKSAGIRTFPLVAMASCAFMLIGLYEFADPEPQARVAYGIITGIGFIGGGAIIKEGGSVTGTATAASIWSTGAIGLAVAHQRFEIALALSLVNFLTLYLGKRFKSKI